MQSRKNHSSMTMRNFVPFRFFKPNIKYIYKSHLTHFMQDFLFWAQTDLMENCTYPLLRCFHFQITLPKITPSHTYLFSLNFLPGGGFVAMSWIQFFSLFFIKNNEVPFFLMVDTLFDLGMVLFVIGSCEEKR